MALVASLAGHTQIASVRNGGTSAVPSRDDDDGIHPARARENSEAIEWRPFSHCRTAAFCLTRSRSHLLFRPPLLVTLFSSSGDRVAFSASPEMHRLAHHAGTLLATAAASTPSSSSVAHASGSATSAAAPAAAIGPLLRDAVLAVLDACRLCVTVQASLVAGVDAMAKSDASPVSVADYGAQAVVLERLTSSASSYPFIAEESGHTLQSNAELLGSVHRHALPFLPRLQSLGREQAHAELVTLIERGYNQRLSHASRRWWTLDPIDGTQGFLRGGQYAVALALLEGTRPKTHARTEGTAANNVASHRIAVSDNAPILAVLGCPALPHSLREPAAGKGELLVAVKGHGAFAYALDSPALASDTFSLAAGRRLR